MARNVFLDDVAGAILGAIVDDNDLVADAADFVQRVAHRLDGGDDVLFLIVAGDEDGEVERLLPAGHDHVRRAVQQRGRRRHDYVRGEKLRRHGQLPPPIESIRTATCWRAKPR